MDDDTIAAISTAPGEAGIAVVRASGPVALEIADRIFRCPPPAPSSRAANTFVRGYVHTGGDDVDEAILLIYRAPGSYTREDVIEIQCHGGRMTAARILATLLAAGARAAEPGEFTRRAFLNGRIDLVQAEAVADLIAARSERAAAAAIEQLEGGLSRRIEACYDDMIDIAASLEATLDFDDGSLPTGTLCDIGERVSAVAARLRVLAETWREGHILRDGALVVITGRPNAGKSTLMNRLLERDRAIVTEHPGTTRDTIEEHVIVDGFPIRLVDTAGLRESECDVEREGIRRARETMANADLRLHVVDGSLPMGFEDRELLQAAPSGRCVVVLSKLDLGALVSTDEVAPHPCVAASLVAPCGDPDGDLSIARLRDHIARALDLSGTTPAHAVVSERHKQNIQNALNAIDACAGNLEDGPGDRSVLAAADLRRACEELGSITGKTYNAELLDRVFGKFCIGK